MSEAFEASGFEANESEASETTTKPKGSRFQVEFIDDGQATGQYRAKYATIVGQVARTHCPPMYKDWAEVPKLTKDALWKNVLEEIDLPLIRKECTFREKGRMEAFVDICSIEEDKTKRFNGKLAREQMKNPHTTGRMGAVPVIEQLEEINKLVSNEPDIVERDLNNDPVAMVIGRDGRGRVRALGGGVTKTIYHASTPYKEIAQREKRAHESSESGYEAVMARLDEADKARKILEDEVADLKRQSSGLGNASQNSGSSAVRVLNSSEADAIFVPYFSSLSYNRHSKVKPPEKMSQNKMLQEKLVRYLTSQEEWKRYPPIVANVEKDVISPYKHVIRTFVHDLSGFENRPTLLNFQGAIYRKDDKDV
ncbi:hypothetical protein IFM89_004316 [Coptis chinensis]|uniref:Uncharacterized protein n=1 Tax=Coptis chinensis TaxID=261450 RepID=A0A835I7B3_9MAGN|nr:hypothetical protein IFM89_004316 [Coptis chinensis]